MQLAGPYTVQFAKDMLLPVGAYEQVTLLEWLRRERDRIVEQGRHERPPRTAKLKYESGRVWLEVSIPNGMRKVS